ncbi:MAG TPA: tetratricopeptide repeat protein, partial [Bacteroidia bacterium]|nr:tetratricopeptide repeat protein [Bacteroidia bacterium]
CIPEQKYFCNVRKNMSNKKLSHKEKIKAKRKEPSSVNLSEDASFAKLKKQLALVLAIVAAALYLNTANHGFNLDDTSAITENWVVKQGVSSIPTIFKTPYRYGYWVSEDELYRPVPLAIFATTWQLFPKNPLPGHIINILLYAVTAYFLFLLLAGLLKSYSMALPFLSVLFFVVHPLHTEVVANIKSFDEIISFLLALVTLKLTLDYLQKNDFKKMLLAMFAFFVAYMSKEGTITMLAVIPLAIYFFTDTERGKIFKATAFLFIPTLIYLGIRSAVVGSITSTKHFAMIDNVIVSADSIGERWATAFKILGKYFLMLVYPHPLSADYSFRQFNINDWDNPWAVISLLLCIGLLIYGITGLKKKKFLAFAALFYLISMALYSNLFVIIGSAFAERFMYVATLGFTLALAWMLLKISGANIYAADKASVLSVMQNKKLWTLALIIILPFSLRALTRNPDWKSYLSLYAADVKNTPDCARMHFFLGNELQKEKAKKTEDKQQKIFWLDSCIAEYGRAIKLYPGYADAYGQLGMAYMLRGSDSLAFAMYNRSIELNTTMAMNYSNFGMYFFNRHDFKNALDLYTRAITLNPRYADGWRNLGSTYGEMKQYEKAINAFQNSLKYEPDNVDVLYFLGITYRSIGREDLAQSYIAKSEKMKRGKK